MALDKVGYGLYSARNFIEESIEHLSRQVNEYLSLGSVRNGVKKKVKVLLYAYSIGVPSSRKIAKRLQPDFVASAHLYLLVPVVRAQVQSECKQSSEGSAFD
jgi:UDP-N-acetylglucosamine:LPS N-acetylglucosamine transferase